MTKVYSEIPPPPKWKTSDLRWPKFTPKYPPTPPKWKTSDLRWPKFTPKCPPPMKNFRFEMTKIYSEIEIPLPPNKKLQIWDDQSLLRNPPPPPNEKLQIWDDQSLLRNNPPPPKLKFRNLGRSWHFEYFQFWLQSTPPLHPVGSGRSYVETKSVSPVDTISFNSV